MLNESQSGAGDGVSLCSMAHPVQPRYRRWWSLLTHWPRLSPDSLETVEIEIRENALNDQEIEQEIKDKGLTAPRVTLADIEAVIAYEYYVRGEELEQISTPVLGYAYSHANAALMRGFHCLTLCVLVLKNGFTVTGEYACASPENFDAALGRKIARQKAVDKIWMLEGYLLKQRLYETAVK